MAQVAENDTAKAAAVQMTEEGTQVVFPRNLIGVRGGLNLSDMIYSQKLVDRYKHYWQPQGMLGLFGHFQLIRISDLVRSGRGGLVILVVNNLHAQCFRLFPEYVIRFLPAFGLAHLQAAKLAEPIGSNFIRTHAARVKQPPFGHQEALPKLVMKF